jgi:DHA1 family bicyclomycin/chloramphenicol resistance-like MFS transporter
MDTSSPSFWRIFIVLGGLAILSPLTLDTFLPAVDDTAKSLNTVIGNIIISIGVLSFGVALGQIIHGPLFDRYGRKPVLVWGLIRYIMASFSTAFITSIDFLYITFSPRLSRSSDNDCHAFDRSRSF